MNNHKSYMKKIFLTGMEPLLKDTIETLKHAHQKIVFTNGCFEILHCGHLDTLLAAKTVGDILIVGLNSNRSVMLNKGRQIIDEKERSRILAAIEFVDFVIIFNEKTPYKIIKYLKPDILVKGIDWSGNIVGSNLVEETIIVPHKLDISTTKIIKKIKEEIK